MSENSSPQSQPATTSVQSLPQIQTQQSSPAVNQSPNVQPQQPAAVQQSPTTNTPQQPPINVNTAGAAASSMTLLDNLTSQLTPERKERFIGLFRQLQTNNVTANEFLAQARMLLDQRQYQQLENLKSKPAPPKTTVPPQQPMSSSQIRAEDAQRSMSGLISPQPKRSRTVDNNTTQPLPLYRSNTAPQQIPPKPQPTTTENTPTQKDGEQGLAQDLMNPELLTKRIKKLIEPMNLKVGQDVETLIALSLEKRLETLLHGMISASKYRVDSQSFTQPPVDETGHHPFKIVDIQDIKKQLLAIERVEREEERKRKEIMLERERKAQLGEDTEEPNKKKKKKDMGPNTTGKYMSDDVRNKTTNETALLIAGGVKKSWMYATTPVSRQDSNVISTSPTSTAYSSFDDDQPRGRGRPRRRKSGSGPDLKKPKQFTRPATTTSDAGLFLPPSTIGRAPRLGEQAMRRVTIRDALFVLEDEYENNTESARRTLLKAYSIYLK